MGRRSDRDYAEQDSSPHVRGCSAATGFRLGAGNFFPAYAGVIRSRNRKRRSEQAFPPRAGGNPYTKSVTIESPALSTHGQGYRRALQTAGTEAASRGGEPCAAVFCALRKGGGSTARIGPRGQKAPHSQFANNSLENRKQRSGRIGETRERSQRIWRGSSCKRKTSCP